VKTIEKLRSGNVLAPELRIKISRAEIRSIVWQTVWTHPRPAAWQRLFPGYDSGEGNKVDSEPESG
jgi:hypothetical protein